MAGSIGDMASEQSKTALPDLRRLFGEGTVSALADVQLLKRFVASRDEAAFAALVAVHGPMVMAVCRRILSNSNDVEDAFQATFLVLVRKARSVRAEGSLGGWLHRVAHRVAVEANRDAVRRRARETRAAVMSTSGRDGSGVPDDFGSALHEELARLPEKFRWPVVLCYLEGKTQEEAAVELRWSSATLRRRLAGPGSGSARGWYAGGLPRRRAVSPRTSPVMAWRPSRPPWLRPRLEPRPLSPWDRPRPLPPRFRSPGMFSGACS
jgi:RNA polymerase sigma factor (sigma-70 family)